MLEALVLAIGLAMDATAVATARSISGMPRRELVVLAVAFGVAQAGMAAAGWLLGASAGRWVAQWDHWIAFALLLLIGGKMLIDAIRGKDDGEASVPPGLGMRTIAVLSVATSIDALAAGVTLPALGAPPAIALVLIGVATFVLSTIGGFVGGRLGAHLGTKLEILGGLALIGIGTKILIDHLTA
jgi:putative Mn2+ efflux pump MntP